MVHGVADMTEGTHTQTLKTQGKGLSLPPTGTQGFSGGTSNLFCLVYTLQFLAAKNSPQQQRRACKPEGGKPAGRAPAVIPLEVLKAPGNVSRV